MKDTGKVLLSLLAGAAAGAVVGLLYAPEAGEEARKKLAKNAKKLNETIKSSIDEISEKSQKAIKEITESMQEARKNTAEKVSKES